MNLPDLLYWRYSTKKFDPSKKISAKDRDIIMDMLQMSPSGTNIQSWHFYVASEESGKEILAKSASEHFSYMRPKLMEASMLILYCSRTQIDDEYMHALLEAETKAGRYTSEEQKQKLFEARNNSANIHRKLGDFQSWLDMQVYLNLGGLLMGVANLGIDALTLEGLNFKALDEDLGLTEKQLKPLAMVSLGYRANDDDNRPDIRPKSRFSKEQVISNLDK